MLSFTGRILHHQRVGKSPDRTGKNGSQSCLRFRPGTSIPIQLHCGNKKFYGERRQSCQSVGGTNAEQGSRAWGM